MAHNTQYTRSRNHNIATGGTQATTWAQIFAGVVLLLGKTTRLVPSRGDTSRVVFPNKRTTSAKIWSVVRIPPVAKILDKASRDRVLVHPQPRPRASNTTTKQVRDPMSLKSMGGGPAESRGSDGKQYTIHTLS